MIRCTRNTRKLFFCAVVAVNVIILFLMFRHQKTDDEQHLQRDSDAILATRNKCDLSITFVIHEFEDFGNNIQLTVETIVEHFPHCKVLIIADHLPYPPVPLDGLENVQLIVTGITPDKPYSDFQPVNYIDSKYIMFVPDGSLIDSKGKVLNMLNSLKSKSNAQLQFIAAGAGDGLKIGSDCLSIDANLRQWTLTYSSAKDSELCDGLASDSILLLESGSLKNLTDVFARPFRESMFIQSALRKWKVKIEPVMFKRERDFLSNAHKKWKHDIYEKERLRVLYGRFGIKKVVQTSGQVEWFGCGKDTSRCYGTVIDDMPDFLFEERWTPPCCLQHLRETAKHVFSVLENAGVRYWLEGGSLLGAARTGDIIPWDYDIDIGIYQEDIPKLPVLKNCELQPIVDDDGFVWEKAREHEGDFYRVQYSEMNRVHVDLFPFYPKNGIMTKNSWMKSHRQDTEFPEKFLKPLAKISFVGLQASAPNNVREFLEFKFGKGVIENPQYADPKKKKFNKKH